LHSAGMPKTAGMPALLFFKDAKISGGFCADVAAERRSA